MSDLPTNNNDGATPPAAGATAPAGGAPDAAAVAAAGAAAGEPPAGGALDAPLDSALGGALGEGAGGDDAGDAAAAVVPDIYEVGDFEGFGVDTEALNEATPFLKEAGLSNDQAKKIMPAAKAFAERTQAAVLSQLAEQGQVVRNQWLSEAKADTEIGGAKYDESIHLAAKGLDALGFTAGHAFRAALTETGFGNHPDMIRTFAKLGRMVGEDGFITGGIAAGGKRDQADTWYGGKKEG